MSYFSHKFTIMITTGINKFESKHDDLGRHTPLNGRTEVGEPEGSSGPQAFPWERQLSASVRKDRRPLVNP